MASPHLSFYYALKDPSTVINKLSFGTDVIQTANGNIYADEELKIKIGSFAFNITVFGGNTDIEDNIYQGTGVNVFFLPEGTISHCINIQFIKDENDNIIVPPNIVNVYQILSGSGDFLNQKGVFVQQTNPINQFRKMMLYFDN